MFRLTIERLRDGESLVMTQNEDKWQLTEVDGLEVPEIDISNYEVASMDGVRISSIRMPDRDIIVTIALKGNVDDNRRQIHNLMRVRSVMRLHFVTDSRRVYIDGYLKSIISNRFSELTMMDLTFNCPDPYFKDEFGVQANMSREYGQWVFPFPFPGKKWPNKIVEGMEYFAMPVSIIDALRTATITSVSENETGIIIEITFRAAADSVRIVNADTGSMFTVSGYDFQVGDVLTINTIDGQKSVTLLRDSVETSLMAYVVDGSDFFQLQSGDNSFNYIIGGNVSLMADVEFIFTPIYFAI